MRLGKFWICKTGKENPFPDQQETIKSRRLGAYKSKIIISGLRMDLCSFYTDPEV
jgi:hypothetical protein